MISRYLKFILGLLFFIAFNLSNAIGQVTVISGSTSAGDAPVASGPVITLSEAVKPALDICDTVTYSIKLTNTSKETFPAGENFAVDVTAIIGFRANATPISITSNVLMWGSDLFNSKAIVNHQLNGIPVNLPHTTGFVGSRVPYLSPNYFSFDPDGPGGLDDIDGDGFYDDLAIGESVVISFSVFSNLSQPACNVGTRDYGRWEHISTDITWYDQNGTLMSPLRQDFSYTNMIRDYSSQTLINTPLSISDGESVTVGIKPNFWSGYTCNGGNAYASPEIDWITSVILPPGLTMDPSFGPNNYTVDGNNVSITSNYTNSWSNFPVTFDCSSWDGNSEIPVTFQTTYVCRQNGIECYRQDVHCYETSILPTCIALPVELSDFKVTDSDCDMLLQWTTTSETNNQYFHIQRSSDNINFQTMAIVAGQGNSTTTKDYRYTDKIEARDKQLYYRLKIVSYDDKITYSPIASILPENCGEAAGDFLNVYPNPVKKGNEVNIIYENETNTSIANLKIISMMGVVVIDYNIDNLESGINDFKVDLSKIPAGNYFLQIENSENRFSRVRLSVVKE